MEPGMKTKLVFVSFLIWSNQTENGVSIKI